MLKNQSISLRLGIAFSSLIAVLIGVGWLGLNRMGQINADLEATVINQWSTVQLSQEALNYSTLNNRITMQVFFLEDRAEIDPLLVRRAENSEKITTLLKTIEALDSTNEERELIAAIHDARAPYVNSYKRALSLLIVDKLAVAAREKMVQETLPLLTSA